MRVFVRLPRIHLEQALYHGVSQEQGWRLRPRAGAVYAAVTSRRAPPVRPGLPLHVAGTQAEWGHMFSHQFRFDGSTLPARLAQMLF